MGREEFMVAFKTYKSAEQWHGQLGKGFKDVYRERTFVQIGGSRYSHADQEQKLTTFVDALSFPCDATEFADAIRGKVYVLGGDLLHLLVLACFARLGLVTRNQSYRDYLPQKLYSGAGSTSLLCASCGFSNRQDARDYIEETSKKHALRASSFENCLCKVKCVLDDGQKKKKKKGPAKRQRVN